MMLVLAMQFSRAGRPQCPGPRGANLGSEHRGAESGRAHHERGGRSLKTEQKTKASGQLGSRPRETRTHDSLERR